MRMAWAALAAAALAAGATTYASSQASAGQRRNALQQQRANQDNYLLNRRQLEEQGEAARTSRLDQVALGRRQMDDAGADRMMMLRQSGIDRMDGLEQRALLQSLAMQDRRRALEGSRDARGNAVEYVEGVGWVERPSARTAQLINASDNEELQRNTVDASRSRMDRGRNYTRRIGEGALANALMSRIQAGRDDSAGTEARAISSNVARESVGDEGARAAINASIVRRGASGVQPNAGGSSVPRTLAAIAEARAAAGPATRTERGNTEAGLMNQYNMMATRASGTDGAPGVSTEADDVLSQAARARVGVQPQALGSGLSGVASGAGLGRSTMNPGAMTATRATAQQTNPQTYQRQMLQAPNITLPVDNTATVIGGAGSSLMNLLESRAFRNLFSGGGGATANNNFYVAPVTSNRAAVTEDMLTRYFDPSIYSAGNDTNWR